MSRQLVNCLLMPASLCRDRYTCDIASVEEANMTNHPLMHFSLCGGLTGLLLPVVLFILVQILTYSRVFFEQQFLATLLIFVVVFLELPAVRIGRRLNLPTENGSTAFTVFGLSVFGYMLAIAFWSLVGLLAGFMIDRIMT